MELTDDQRKRILSYMLNELLAIKKQELAILKLSLAFGRGEFTPEQMLVEHHKLTHASLTHAFYAYLYCLKHGVTAENDMKINQWVKKTWERRRRDNAPQA